MVINIAGCQDDTPVLHSTIVM